MPSLVELQYNPYLPRLDILINGKQPTSFSRLIQYMDEDIWKWSDNILESIYAEIREDYILSFIGNKFDADIMKNICHANEHCIGFKSKDFIVSDNVQARLGKLNQLIKKTDMTTYEKTVIDAYFLLSQNYQQMMEEINAIDINNLFCAVRIQMLGAKRNYEDDSKNVLFIVVESMDKGSKYLKDFDLQHPAYVIVIGNDSGVIGVTDKGIFVETKQENLFETIFNCFLHRPLIVSMQKCIRSIKGGRKISKELLKISSTEPIVNVVVDNKVEVGKSIKISVTLVPDVGKVPKLIYSVLNQEIASCDGINFYGLKEGISTLEVYKQGSNIPLHSQNIKVYKRNRINRLILSDDSLLIGIGDTRQLKLDYYPYDADNKDKIVWKSSDDMVISVSQNGQLEAKNVGKCRIICTAENVSVQCICTVLPYMEDLVVDVSENEYIHMTPMQEMNLSYRIIPDDCIDKKLIITSSDNDIVNVVNGKLFAKNKGNVQINIRNETGRINRTFNVVVERRIKAEKKSGFFNRLFS